MPTLLAVALNLGLFVLATSLPLFQAAHHHWIFPALAVLLAAQWAAALLPGGPGRRAFRAAALSLLGLLLIIGIARHATILACFERCSFKLALAAALAAAVFLAQARLGDLPFWDRERASLAGWGCLLWAVYLALFGLGAAPWASDVLFMALAAAFWLGRSRAVFLLLSAAILGALAVRATGDEHAIIAGGLILAAAPLWLLRPVERRLARPAPAASSRALLLAAVAAALGFYVVGPTFLTTSLEERRALLLRLAPAPRSAALSPLAERLREHVRFLAEKAAERDAFQPRARERALAYVEEQLRLAGYEPRRLEYDPRLPGRFANVEALLPAAPAGQGAWVVGAHWDAAPGTPGADDNASGVAVLLEVARALRGRRLAREVRFVAFGTEEPPSFGTTRMGSYDYARRLKEGGVKVHGMLSLEMLGYFNERRGSQLYPPFLHLVNPDRGDYVAAVSNAASRTLLRQFARDWRASSAFPLVTSVLPGALSSLAISDQLNFWSLGIPALLLSDTGFYRNPHYHQDGDRPATLDYERMAAAVEALIGALDPENAARERNEIDDAGRLNRTPVADVVAVRGEDLRVATAYSGMSGSTSLSSCSRDSLQPR